MIFVLLGTQDASFTRLTNMVKALVEANDWSEQVIIQSGTTVITWENEHVITTAFFAKTEFQTHFQNARVIITHGGAGSMFEALNARKKTIVVPRLAQYKEHVDNHQLELAQKLSELGYLELHHSESLKETLAKVEKQEYKHYKAEQKLVDHIQRRFT